MVRRWLPRVLIAGVALFALAQLVPYGRSHKNPTPTQEAKLPSGPGREVFAGACADCHSDTTTWPWYSHVAPVSWLVQKDVEDGRSAFNVSRWDLPQPGVGDAVEQAQGGEMPPIQYEVIHGAARLSSTERGQLAAWLRTLYAADPPASTRGGGD